MPRRLRHRRREGGRLPHRGDHLPGHRTEVQLERQAGECASASDYAAALALRERAFSAWRARGDARRAAHLAAYQIAFDHLALFGKRSVAQGWLERGVRLAQEAGECAGAGWVALAQALHTTDLPVRASLAGEATRVAKLCGDADLMFDALAYSGLASVDRAGPAGRHAGGPR